MSKIVFQEGRKILWGAPASSGYTLHLIFSSLSLCKKWFTKRLYTKIIPMDVFVSGTIDQRKYLKNLGGSFSPLAPPWIRL